MNTVTSALEIARAALLESIPADHVGKALDSVVEPSQDSSVTITSYTFECTSAGYPGWYWEVSVVEISGQSQPTVSEVNLLPGAAALVPAAWKPWADRVEAGDLGVGDLLPPPENDDRLTAGFTGLGDLEDISDDLAALHPVQWELGLGREKVLSTIGQERAVNRWFEKLNGPKSAMAKSAPAHCGSCGFLVAIGGSMGQVFGVCGNEFGAADGQVVATTFGCGAHSSVRQEQAAPIPVVDLVIDDHADAQSDSSDLPDYVAEPVQDVSEFDEDVDLDETGGRSENIASEFAMKEAVEAIEAASEFIEMENLDADEAEQEIADFYGDSESDTKI
ncbi:MAG: DUF3027 domain-containing protein [Actinomycetes bacterium]